jgi:hypothetical protein
VLGALDIDLPAVTVIEERTVKAADEVNDDWIARYRSLSADSGEPAAGG